MFEKLDLQDTVGVATAAEVNSPTCILVEISTTVLISMQISILHEGQSYNQSVLIDQLLLQ